MAELGSVNRGRAKETLKAKAGDSGGVASNILTFQMTTGETSHRQGLFHALVLARLIDSEPFPVLRLRTCVAYLCRTR